jgi:hypothetical protein
MPWEQLIDIVAENRRALSENRFEPPIACPFDGEILDVHPNSTRNCPLGNYFWNGGPKIL